MSQPFACSLKTVRIGKNIGEREAAPTLVYGKEKGDGNYIIFQFKTTHYYVTFMVDRLTGQIDLTALAP